MGKGALARDVKCDGLLKIKLEQFTRSQANCLTSLKTRSGCANSRAFAGVSGDGADRCSGRRAFGSFSQRARTGLGIRTGVDGYQRAYDGQLAQPKIHKAATSV